MKPFKILHMRHECISCGACTTVNPDEWAMSDIDDKADLIDSKEINAQEFEKEIDADKKDSNLESAEVCPVNCIHILDQEKNEKLI